MTRLNQWWPFDSLAFGYADAQLSDRQSIARIRLMNYAWGNGCRIPLDSEVISRIARCPPKVWLGVMGEFTHTPDGWVHEPLMAELQKAANIQKQRVEAGKRSAESRSGRSATVERPLERPLNHACPVPVTVVVSDSGVGLSKERNLGGMVGDGSVVPLRKGDKP